jgi:hypothetical protein
MTPLTERFVKAIVEAHRNRSGKKRPIVNEFFKGMPIARRAGVFDIVDRLKRRGFGHWTSSQVEYCMNEIAAWNEANRAEGGWAIVSFERLEAKVMVTA